MKWAKDMKRNLTEEEGQADSVLSVGAQPQGPEIMTWAETKSQTLNLLSHPVAPSVFTIKIRPSGNPGWRSGLAPAFGPGRDPGDPGSNPTWGSRCMEPASPSACVSASLSLSLSLSLCDYHKNKNKNK